MNANDYNALWSRFLGHDPLTESEANELHRHVKASEKQARFYSDDQVIHSLLTALASEKTREDFIRRCLDQFEEQQQLKEGEVHIKAATSIHRQTPVHSTKHRVRRRLVATIMLAAASLVVITCLAFIVRDGDTDKRITDEPQTQPEPSIVSPAIGESSLPQVEQDREESLPSLEHIDPSIVTVPETPSEEKSKPDFSFELPLKREQITQRTPDKNLRDNAFATIVFERGARWEVPPAENGRVTDQTLKLETGLAALQLDNQVRVQLSSPAEIAVESLDKLRLISGKIRVSIPDSVNNFVVLGRDGQLNSKGPLDVYLAIDNFATELVLTAGQLQLQRKSALHEIPAVALSSAGLNHAYLNATNADTSVPVIVVAHGPTRYFGQMAFASQTQQWNSPDDLERAFANGDQKQETIDQIQAEIRRELFEQIKRFNSLFRQRDSSKNNAELQNESQRQFSFQGEITIDGESVDFSSPSEFDKFFHQSSGNQFP